MVQVSSTGVVTLDAIFHSLALGRRRRGSDSVREKKTPQVLLEEEGQGRSALLLDLTTVVVGDGGGVCHGRLLAAVAVPWFCALGEFASGWD